MLLYAILMVAFNVAYKQSFFINISLNPPLLLTTASHSLEDSLLLSLFWPNSAYGLTLLFILHYYFIIVVAPLMSFKDGEI